MPEDLSPALRDQLAGLSKADREIAMAVLLAMQEAGEHGGPFTRLLGLTFTEFGNGRCAANLTVRAHHLNPLNVAHGGVAYALADTVCGGAALSAVGAPRIVTQDMQIRYHGPSREGRLEAVAEVIYHGTRTITTQCRVTQSGVLVASVTGTFAILNDKELNRVRGA
jgi:acyl-CoA thioesterase